LRGDISAATICANSPFIAYGAFGSSITTGTELFTDTALTSPLIGYNFIEQDGGSGEIFEIGGGNGVIGLSTGLFC
jgi:hypothetical protein